MFFEEDSVSHLSHYVNIQAILVKMFIFKKWCINVKLAVLQGRGFTGSFKNVKVIFKQLLFKVRRWNTRPRGFKDEKKGKPVFSANRCYLRVLCWWKWWWNTLETLLLHLLLCTCTVSLLVKIHPSCLSPNFERTSWWWQESTGSVNIDFLRLPGGASSCQFWQWHLCYRSTLLHGL